MFKYEEVKADSKIQAITYVLSLNDVCSDLKLIILGDSLSSIIQADNKKLQFKLYSGIDDAYTKFSHTYLSFLYLNQKALNVCELSNKLKQLSNFHLIKVTAWPDDNNFKTLMCKLTILIEKLLKLKIFIKKNRNNFVEILDTINEDFLKLDEEFYKIITSIHVNIRSNEEEAKN